MGAENRPEKRKNGKTYCRSCGEQVVFMWKDKPRYCAMCGDDFNWSSQKTAVEWLREAYDLADKQGCMLVKIDAEHVREILAALETPEGEALMRQREEEKAISEEPEMPEVAE